MKPKSVQDARRALSAYGMADEATVEPVPTGLIHSTFKVTLWSEAAGGQRLFCFQALHPNLSGDPFLEDYAAVTAHLAEKKFPAPRLVRTRANGISAEVHGTRWRLSTWLPGVSFDTVEGEKTAFEAAQMLGRFHMAAADIACDFQSPHPLHDSRFHLEAFRSALAAGKGDSGWAKRVRSLADPVMSGLEANLLPGSLPMRVVHGDPKISNVLFDPVTGRATGLVDLDICNRHTVLVDLGDAVRSWCSGPEDVVADFNMDLLQATLEGYAASRAPLTEQERGLIPRCGPLITWELASRFLRDAIESLYFGWDPLRYESRRHHNWVRGRAMAALAGQMERRAGEIAERVGRIWR